MSKSSEKRVGMKTSTAMALGSVIASAIIFSGFMLGEWASDENQPETAVNTYIDLSAIQIHKEGCELRNESGELLRFEDGSVPEMIPKGTTITGACFEREAGAPASSGAEFRFRTELAKQTVDLCQRMERAVDAGSDLSESLRDFRAQNCH